MSDVGIMLLLFVGVMGLVSLIRFLAWLTDLQTAHGSIPRAALHTIQRYVIVNTYQEDAQNVMSRTQIEASKSGASAAPVETDAGQTPDRRETPKIRSEKLLTVYRLMRAAGIERKDAQAAFAAAELPFNNNVWAQAEPPAPLHITPIAGRRTPAQFESDPELAYEPPERN